MTSDNNGNKVILDTNVLISDINCLSKYEHIVLPIQVLEEIDKLVKDPYVGYQARQSRKAIENSNNIEFIIIDTYDVPTGWDKDKIDNKIIMTAKQTGYKMISNDCGVRIKCKSIGVECEKYEDNNKESYKGFKEIILTERELATFYERKENIFDLDINEYMLIKLADNPDVIVDKMKWTENGFKPVSKKSMKSLMFGNISAKDVYQEIAMDSLMNDTFTILTGKPGSGKSLLSLVYSMWALQNQKYDKLIIMFNPCKTRGSTEMGYYSGDKLAKGLQQFVGNVLTSKFGDSMATNTLISQNKIDLIPISDARGMEITDNQILYITEAQNLTIDLCKLAIQRVSKDAKIIFEGDIETQVDNRMFEGNNNGLRRAIEVFKGEDVFSCVNLPNVHRSKMAEIAERM